MDPVLIIDDNEAVRTALSLLLDVHGIPTVSATSPAEALLLADRQTFSAVIQDMNFEEDATSGEEGVQLFRALRQKDPFLPILLITAWSSLETAVQLVKEGAHDYLSKPWNDTKLLDHIKAILQKRNHMESARQTTESGFQMVYDDPKTRRTVEMALQFAKSDASVMITGPNGSGKEILAQLIQSHSNRAKGPFVKVNVGALPDTLFEAEFFGAEQGAFTGAKQRRIGRFEEADRGTLFLDEIGNLDLKGQMKLLRVLQTGEFNRLGSNQMRRADVRVISATNADLPQAIQSGDFREDLFFRLNVVELDLPALKDRIGDILPLAHHFLKTLPNAIGKQLSPDAQRALLSHTWPGNVRELRNRMQRAVLISNRPNLTASDLGLQTSEKILITPELQQPEDYADIQRALLKAQGNISQAAKQLGLTRQSLYRRMNKYGIEWEKRPK